VAVYNADGRKPHPPPDPLEEMDQVEIIENAYNINSQAQKVDMFRRALNKFKI
jgi:hypothetical protein